MSCVAACSLKSALVALALGACMLPLGCEFQPVVRRAQPQQISAGSLRLLRALDPLGEHVLVARSDEDGQQRTSISAWRKHERCDLTHPAAWLRKALVRPLHAPHGSPALFAPLLLPDDEGSQLALIDEHCTVHGPYAELAGETLRSFVDPATRGSYLSFRDHQDTLFVFDPWGMQAPLPIADAVREVQSPPLVAAQQRAALWLNEGGTLTERAISGELLVSLGQTVSEFALAIDNPFRVAYVDGGVLYEAVAPEFVPVELAADACTLRYGEAGLDFFSPCAAQALLRKSPGTDVLQRFPLGVFASLLDLYTGVRLDYVQIDSSTVQLVAQSKQYSRRGVDPLLSPLNVYVLDQRRITGLSPSNSFGTWDGVDRLFTELLSDVDTVLPHFRGKKHQYSWLIHHDSAAGPGGLSVVTQQNLTPKLLARGVPPAKSGGFIMDRGTALPNYPFAEPIVILLEQASALPDDPTVYTGRLRALLLSGKPAGDLADDVSSFLLVASPVPGVLYTVADQGLWFVGL